MIRRWLLLVLLIAVAAIGACTRSVVLMPPGSDGGADDPDAHMDGSGVAPVDANPGD